MAKQAILFGSIVVFVSFAACAPPESQIESQIQESVEAALQETYESLAASARAPRARVDVRVCDSSQGCDCAATPGCVECDVADAAGLVFTDIGGGSAVDLSVRCPDKRGGYCFSEQARVVWLIAGLGPDSHRGVIAHQDKGAGSPPEVYEVPPAEGRGVVLLQSLGLPQYTGDSAEWEYRLDLYLNPTDGSDSELLACADPRIKIDP